MLPIEQVSSDTLQKQTLVLPDGSFIVLTLYFMPMQASWFIRELVYQDFTLKNVRVTTGPNMLYQFKNQIPFGLGCFTKLGRDPMLQEDFSSQQFKLYVLTEAEVLALTEIYENGNG